MNNPVLKQLDQQTETVVKLKIEIDEIKAEAANIVVNSIEQLSVATDLVRLVKDIKKEAESDRTSITKPLNDVLSNINARYKPITNKCDEIEKTLKGKIQVFQTAEQRRQREVMEAQRQAAIKAAEAEAARQIEKGNEQGAMELVQHAERIEAAVIEAPKFLTTGNVTGAKVSSTKRWTYKVVDIKALANSRPDLVAVESSLIRRAIAEGARTIEGLEIYQEESVSIR